MFKRLKRCFWLASKLYAGHMRYLIITVLTGTLVFFLKPLVVPFVMREIFGLAAGGEEARLLPVVLITLAVVAALSVAASFLIIYADTWAIFLITNGCTKSYEEIYSICCGVVDGAFTREDQVNRVYEGSDGPSSSLAIIMQCLAMSCSLAVILTLMAQISPILLPAGICLILFEIFRIKVQMERTVAYQEKAQESGARLQGAVSHLVTDAEQLAFMEEERGALYESFKEYQEEYWRYKRKGKYVAIHCNFFSDLFFAGIKSAAYGLFRGAAMSQAGALGSVSNMLDSFRDASDMTISFAGELPEYMAKTDRLYALLSCGPHAPEAKTRQEDGGFSLRGVREENAVVLEGVNLRLGERQILKDVSITVKKGEKVALVGENGSGKSTCLKVILGQCLPDSGTVRVLGRPAEELEHTVKWKQLSYIPVDNQLFALTARENIWLGCDGEEAAIPDLGTDTGFLDRGRDQASAGQKRMTNIVRALQKRAPVLAADEPDAELDPKLAERMMDLILESCETAVVITHNAKFLERFDRVLKIEAGRITPLKA